MITYKAGINLGGWLSQYKEFSKEHFDTFIVEKDIEVIAAAGFDHIRVPFDYPLIEKDEAPGIYIEEGLKYIDVCLEWCRKYQLGMVLDMHHAPGYRFQDIGSNTLFEDIKQQNRFIDLWKFLADRYVVEREHIAFELLNEIVEPDSSRWNKLMLECIDGIRSVDPTRWIYVGGNNYNSPDELKNIAKINDEYIVYNFHFYNPFFFTHQKASWTESARLYNRSVSYPGQYEGIEAFVNEHKEFEFMMAFNNLDLNKELLKKDLQSAIAFREQKNCQLYCGEFGVITHADLESRVRWHKDFVELLSAYEIGGAVWSYKEMNFAVYNNDQTPIFSPLIDILTRKNIV